MITNLRSAQALSTPGVATTANSGVFFRDDFDCYNLGANNLINGRWIASGNAGGGQLSTPATTQPQSGRWGIAAFGAGTTNNATGAGQLFSDLATCYAGYAEIILDFAIQTPTNISDATNEYVLDFGFNDSTSSGGAAANGFAIQYKRTTSTNWSAYTANASTLTTVTSANAAALAVTALTWWNGRIYVNRAGTQVDFYMGASGSPLTLIGSSTTNIPVALAQKTIAQFQVYKAATFAVQRAFHIDWIQLQMNFTTAR